MWLLAHPFSGVWHDGKFYALQALRGLNPDIFSHDLFFLYGSQDQFSLFSALYGLAISYWGINGGTAFLQAVGLLAWFAALAFLVRTVLGERGIWALLLIAGVDGHYGSHGLVSYGEPFLTGRLYAEALSFAGLAALLQQRVGMSGLFFAAAGLAHPLIALPALFIGLGAVLSFRVWCMLMGIGSAVALCLGFLGISPFTGLLHPMDADWFGLATARSPFVFLHTWEWDGFSRAIFVGVLVGLASRILPDGPGRRLARVTLICMAGGFAIAYFGGSLLKLPLIAGLQLPRVMWIALVIALMLLPWMLYESRSRNIWDQFLIGALAVGVFLNMESQGGYALLAVAIYLVGKKYLSTYAPRPWVWALVSLVPLQILVWEILEIRMEAEWATLLSGESSWRIYIANPVVGGALLAGGYWLLRGRKEPLPPRTARMGQVVGVVFISFAATTWYDPILELDYESPQRRLAIAPVAALVPSNATVYWVEEPEKAWFWLRRSNYLSFSQSAGSVFSRGTAIEAARRASYVRAVSPRDASQMWDEPIRGAPLPLVSASAVRKACRDPLLDYVIGRSEAGSGTLHFKDPATGWGYSLYSCRGLRF